MPVDLPEDVMDYDDCTGDEAYCNVGDDVAGKILTHLYSNIGLGELNAKDDGDWLSKGVMK